MQKRMVVMGTVSPLGFFMKGLFFVFFTLAVLSTGAFAQNDNGITVERIIICETVENREPVSDASTFTASEKICCFTEITGAEDPTHIKHVWYREGEEYRSIALNIGGARWRTYSEINVPSNSIGDWKVGVIDADEKTLAEITFTISSEGVVEIKKPEDKQPVVISALEGQIPSDAVVLFDGSDLSEWTYTDGKPAEWIVSGGTMTVKGGGIMTKKEFDDMQLHIEFASPSETKGEGQDRGNSGVYLQGIYEIQVLDSYGNETYANGMCGAVYSQYVPLVNASRPPGKWQVYDIIFHAAIFDGNDKVVKKPTVTVLHNGVLIQDHVSIKSTPGGPRDTEQPTGPIFLQDHNHPVQYRNIWVREL